MFGSFGAEDSVYPAYHMNKLHWISVFLPDAPEDVTTFLVNVSYEATKTKTKKEIIMRKAVSFGSPLYLCVIPQMLYCPESGEISIQKIYNSNCFFAPKLKRLYLYIISPKSKKGGR